MDKHFHVWTRAGKTFLMRDRKYRTRSHANKDAVALRPDQRDRMVRECEQCPESRRSRRRPPRWAKVAREVAETVGADPAAVRTALEAALAGEREERADAGVLADEAADRQARRTREATALRFEGRKRAGRGKLRP